MFLRELIRYNRQNNKLYYKKCRLNGLSYKINILIEKILLFILYFKRGKYLFDKFNSLNFSPICNFFTDDL